MLVCVYHVCTEHKVIDDKSVVSSLVRIPDAAIFVL